MHNGISHAEDLFRYDDWASAQLIGTLREASLSDAVYGRILDLLSHLLRTRLLWLGRVEASPDAGLPFWQRDTLDACAARAKAGTAAWLRHLASCTDADLTRTATYTNSKGITYTSTLREVITHVVNHGTHHRAQIALLLRDNGVAPPLTDYIFYTRR